MSRACQIVSLLLLMSLLNMGTVARGFSQTLSADAPGGAAASAKQANKQPDASPVETPRVLMSSSPRPVLVPPFAYGDVKCDSSRNMYLKLGGGNHNGQVLEISRDGKGSNAFAPPKPDNLVFTQFRDFFVTVSGTLYYLMQDYKNDYAVVVLEFDPNGIIRRTIKPQVPDRRIAESFAVFDDGSILLKGHVQLGAPHMSEPTEPYLGLFDANGKLRKELPALPDSEVALQGGSMREGAIAIGKDGNAYLTDANYITVISVAGEIERRMNYTKPTPNLIAKGLTVSDGLLAITVVEVDGTEVIPRYLVVSAKDGETVGYYTLPDESHNSVAVCFSRSEGFTFLKRLPEENKLVLLDAALQ